jgi:4-amino-4-deoxy-L-arabinose transferase-like glycosyltransferase
MTKNILLIILFLGFIFRIAYINYPPLLWDEASIGYNAYSILKTGRDEYGQTLPLIFKSFGDFKPGLFIYLTVPLVALFGLNPLSTRLPSVILGSLLPLLLYLLILKLSPKSKSIALISAILLAFNPWNIHFSRGAWETNVLLFELLLAAYFFISQKLFLSSLVFISTLYTYQGGKLMSPLIILILLIIYRYNLKLKPLIFNFFLPLIIFSLPVLYGLLVQNDSNRLKVFSLWAYNRPSMEITQIIDESNSFNYLVFHSKPLFFLRNFTLRYFNHLSAKFLIFDGDWQVARHSAPYIGAMLYPSLIFLIIGVFFSLITKPTPINIFFFLWLLIGPLPSALTRDSIQPVRSLSLSLPLIYFTALGIKTFLDKFKSKIIILSILFLYLISFIYYQDLYFNHMVKVKPSEWLYGYQQAMTYALSHEQNKQVYFSDFYGQPYIYYLFFSRFDPASYQKQANLIVTGPDVGRVDKINNFNFRVPDFSSFKKIPSTLMIFSYDDAVRQGIDLKILTPLSPINGISTFYAYETN